MNASDTDLHMSAQPPRPATVTSAATPGQRLSVLWIGIDPHRFPGPWDADELAATLSAGAGRFPPGVLETWLFGPDDDLEELLATKLAEVDWTCVVVGRGLRVGAVPLPVFEQIVNAVRQHAPGAAIAFNDTLTDALEAAARWVPALAQSSERTTAP
ncbi:hypothetical protein GCU67_13940 [Modestobacter muralis]|uniref:Uncharacterized protein n=1 Tax=Modestobacter muralis TaxID=1608614 RepID=A0A6P0EW14_9ACTN|nr:hypothetical protein [Modestobacter muralis]NEK95255.1 hypothetical protein [Modestobacter muralis]NEN52143.1 hypothetical protein [Modestobacter muralis]